MVLISLHIQVFQYEIHFEFSSTNNIYEYKAFLACLGLAKSLEAFPLHAHDDSQLAFETKDLTIMKYLQKVQVHLFEKDKGKEISIDRIPREENGRADLLSKLASSNLIELFLDVLIEKLKKPNIKDGLMSTIVDTKNNWRSPFKYYLLTRKLLLDRNKTIHVIG